MACAPKPQKDRRYWGALHVAGDRNEPLPIARQSPMFGERGSMLGRIIRAVLS